MSGHQVRVTYYINDHKKDGGLAEAEVTLNRSWTGTGYEALTLLAKRCTPGIDSEWMTIIKDDGAALSFRPRDLESIEYEVIDS